MANDRARRFDPVTVARDGVLRRVHQLTCQCGAETEVSANTHSGARAHEDLRRVFGRRGWFLGRSPDQDVCPDCQSKRRGKEDQMAKEGKVVALAKTEAKGDVMPPAREPTFDDRRIIIAALQDHYLNEREGYAPGFTDHRIAADLGVPRKWVEDIRAANFGPVKDNEDIRALIVEARAMLTEARDLANKAEEVTLARVAFTGRLDNLERRIADIEKAVR